MAGAFFSPERVVHALPSPWLILPLEIRFDLFEREPRRAEFTARVQRGLIEVMRRLGIAARAHGVDCEPPNLGTEFYHADVGPARDSVAPLLAGHRPSDI